MDQVADRTPRERWGTCCPHDPECDHSFLDGPALARWMDSPLTDAAVLALVHGDYP